MKKMRKPKGDVYWYLPGKKKPTAYSTRAASDLIVVMAREYNTIKEIYDAVNYDEEAKEVLGKYIDAGFGARIARDMFK